MMIAETARDGEPRASIQALAGAQSVEESIRLAAQVAEALDAAHTKSVVHRLIPSKRQQADSRFGAWHGLRKSHNGLPL
jgi:hypothetical protein